MYFTDNVPLENIYLPVIIPSQLYVRFFFFLMLLISCMPTWGLVSSL